MRFKTRLTQALTESDPNDENWKNQMSMFGPSFKGLRAGDTVYYWKSGGMSIDHKTGKTTRDKTQAKGKVLRYLTFPDHVMVSGGPFGEYVDEKNFIRKG